jgi:hypothetical protein
MTGVDSGTRFSILSTAVATREIRTSGVDSACDVCGRTLLRGERAEVYLDGGARRSVCELCKPRALNEGWVREGTLPTYGGDDAAPDRRRSLLGRFRRRRDSPPSDEAESTPERTSGPLIHEQPWVEPTRPAAELQVREPRHVHAIPMGVEHKMAAAVEAFNNSEHPRTVAGVARSLGSPAVAVLPVHSPPSLVRLVVSWELSWYRYEVDLADELPSVRVVEQGPELHELAPEERDPNAVSDQHGLLSLA